MPKADQTQPGGRALRIVSIASVVAGAPPGMPRQSWSSGGASNRPSPIMRAASATWPRSNTSSSGFTPASRIIRAMASMWRGMLTMACGPKFIVATSSEQTSGRSSSTCCTRASGVAMLVPGPPRVGSCRPG